MTDDMAATQPEPAPHIDALEGGREDGSVQQDAGQGDAMTAGPELTGPDGEAIITQAQEQAPSLAAPSPDAAPPARAEVPAGRVLGPGEKPSGGRVTLAPVPPLGSVVLPPLEEGGKGFVIEENGTEVDADTAARAQAVALEAGFRLQEL